MDQYENALPKRHWRRYRRDNDENTANSSDSDSVAENEALFPGAYDISQEGQTRQTKGTLTPAPNFASWDRARRDEIRIETSVENASDTWADESIGQQVDRKSLSKEAIEQVDAKNLRKGTVAAICCVFILVAVAVAVAVNILSGDNIEESPTASPTESPSEIFVIPESERAVAFRQALRHFSLDPTVLASPSTPQYHALGWLADLDVAAIELENTKRLQTRYALATIFYATNGNGWIETTGFLSEMHECDWQGVGCNAADEVTSLALDGNGLFGSIPNEFRALSNLKVLDFTNNRLGSSLPPGIFELSTLQILRLDNNDFTSTIPPALSSLTSLDRLHLAANRLSGSLPTELALLTDLFHLHVWGNSLMGNIEDVVGSLPNLETLHARDNKFSVSPDLRFPRSLHYLDLEGSLFEATPLTSNVGLLSNLRLLNLKSTNLRGTLPTELARMTALGTLKLQGNQGLSGTLPWSSLSESTLRVLDVNSCNLHGELPSDIGRFTALTFLGLERNRFEGSIPESFGGLTALEYLDVANNFFAGSIPSSVGMMTSLSLMSAEFNELSGWLPTEMTHMSSLVGVDLVGNDFAGGSLEFICDRQNDDKLVSLVGCRDNIICSCCDCC